MRSSHAKHIAVSSIVRLIGSGGTFPLLQREVCLSLGNADVNLAGFVKATLEGIFSCFDFHLAIVFGNGVPQVSSGFCVTNLIVLCARDSRHINKVHHHHMMISLERRDRPRDDL